MVALWPIAPTARLTALALVLQRMLRMQSCWPACFGNSQALAAGHDVALGMRLLLASPRQKGIVAPCLMSQVRGQQIRGFIGFPSKRRPLFGAHLTRGSVAAAAKQNVQDEPLVRYADLAKTMDEVNTISGVGSREKVLNTLMEFFKRARLAGELQLAVKLAMCSFHHAKTGFRISVGKVMIMKAIHQINIDGADLKRLLDDGSADDVGSAVEILLDSTTRNIPHSSLSLAAVFESFAEIGHASGTGSRQQRVDIMAELLTKASGTEAKYILRTLIGTGPRVGATEKSIIKAVAYSMDSANSGELATFLLYSLAVNPDIDQLVDRLLEGDLRGARARWGMPITPMAASPVRSVEDVLARMHTRPGPDVGPSWTAEWKYDGERLQIHVARGRSTAIFSRNLHNVTEKYPDVATFVKLREGQEDVVIDAEVVAIGDKGELLAFQELSKRPRKGASPGSVSNKVHVFAFDCLMSNGVSIMHLNLAERRKELMAVVDLEGSDSIRHVQHQDFTSESELQEALAQSIHDSTEGLMVKRLAAPYCPGKRSMAWLKLKKDYLGKNLCDSIDAVVIGVSHGEGKRSGVFGSFLLAVPGGPSGNELQTLCCVGTGITDEELEAVYNEYKVAVKTEPPPGFCPSSMNVAERPEYWLHDGPVWELWGADLTVSKIHSCARGEVPGACKGSGLGLRFPRVIRMRDKAEKGLSSSTPAAEILRMYTMQPVRGGEEQRITAGYVS